MNTSPSPSPLVHRRRLRTELRRVRAGTGFTQEQVAAAMDWSLSKVIRIENGAVSISTNDLRALLNLYEIHDQNRTDELIELARASRQPSWWGKYREALNPQYLQLIEYEEAATVLRTYEPLLVPGLLQTEEYAATILRKFSSPGTPAEVIRTRIEIRLMRQQLLAKAEPPTLICVLNEAVVEHLVGDRNIAEAQIERLIQLAGMPNVTIEIIPYSAGLHRGMLEPFLVLEFPDPEDREVVFVESPRDMIFSDDEAGDITGYRELFEEMRRISMGPARTLTYLASAMK